MDEPKSKVTVTRGATWSSHSRHSRRHARSQSAQHTQGSFRESLHAFTQDLSDGSRKLNQYRIKGVIGSGSYGVVHLGELIEDPTCKVALKEFGKARLRRFRLIEGQRRRDNKSGAGHQLHDVPIPNSEDADEDPLFLIRSEIAIMKRLRHPNVVQLFEVLDDAVNQCIYMVFEYCGGGPIIKLDNGLDTEPLPEEKARDYFVQIVQGVDYLHANGIVHRDIKPDNLLLTDDGKMCKIVDFGVSEMMNRGNDTMHHAVGSPAFMSPELCTHTESATQGRSDDIWALGVSLYVMLVGRLPFDPSNMLDLTRAIIEDEPEYPSTLSADAKDLLQRMLAKSADDRITTRQILKHPWATYGGKLEFKPVDDVQHKTLSEEEIQCAICRISSMFTVARAVSKFKRNGRSEKSRSNTSTNIPEPESDNRWNRRTRSDGIDKTPSRDPDSRPAPINIPDVGEKDDDNNDDASDDPVMLNGMPLCSSP
ncbi:non-specific serine/threonine protein kinase [Malassezia cuniculi]|uniref:Non-specific serine/threonine protein kinase n=1 Tax=Malassezia cuniculi TaxID=948313 RepID=A0AAF0J4W5_9BASI|nr:non-specific serine/threonine protein kinase [Malassezia cuniculi]